MSAKEPTLMEDSPTTHESVRAREIVELFREEIQVLRREIQETRKASSWHMQVANPQALTIWQKALMDHPMPSRLRTLLIDSLADLSDTDEAEAQLHAILNESLNTSLSYLKIFLEHTYFWPIRIWQDDAYRKTSPHGHRSCKSRASCGRELFRSENWRMESTAVNGIPLGHKLL